MKYSGSCFCQKVKLEIDSEPLKVLNCHCKDCQKWTGCAYETAVVFDVATVKVNGSIKFFDSLSDQGNTVSRGFCSDCGGAVMNKSTGLPDKAIVYAGVIDWDNMASLNAEIYYDNVWFSSCMLSNTKKFQGYFSQEL